MSYLTKQAMAFENKSERKLDFLSKEKTPSDKEVKSSDKGSDRWKVMVVDDDDMVHSVSRMVLNNVTYDGKGIEIICGHSGEDARRLMVEHPDTAMILLDVVMETDTAGLDVVKYVREELNNHFVRIILRTGQAGDAPEHKIIAQYDINDYKEKSELTAQKLHSTVIVTLRAFNGLKKIEELSRDRARLKTMADERAKHLKTINTELSANKNRLAEAQRIAHIGYWEWFIEEDRCSCSPEAQHIMGITQHPDNANRETLINLIPDDEEKKRLIEAMNRSITDGMPYDIEHYIKCGNKEVVLVRHRGEPVRDENGKIMTLIGTLQDITDQRKTDEMMKKLSGAITQAADAVMITNVSGIIEYVNPAFEEMTGYSEVEMIGKTPRLLKSGKQGERFYERMWKIIHKGEVFSDIVINRRKDGMLYYEEKTITPLKDSNGTITSYISTGRDITSRMETQQQLLHLAHHDVLTGLPNRALLQDRLTQLLSRIKQSSRNIAVLFIDLDRFKVINDTLGHDIGDRLLQQVSERLSDCVREGDTVARLGGDEFSVVLNDIARKDDIELVAEKIIDQMANPFLISQQELFITASIGIALAPDDGNDTQTLLKKADKAMYHAKESGKNRFQFYTKGDQDRAIERLTLETALRRALKREEFSLHYQPQIDLHSGSVCGAEALLRWQHPMFKDVSPMNFIPLLEETGMIVDVGTWVLETACQQAVEWKEKGTELRVAVNLSARQFQQAGFIDHVGTIISASNIDTRFIELEITEGILIDDIDEITKQLHRLHEMGIRIAIDDFGTGFSSMNYLKKLPVDALKIDRCFIKDINENPDDEAIASGMISLAHSLNLEVVAEGVENLGQLELLRKNGLDQIQGYIYSPPRPVTEIDLLMKDHDARWSCIING